MVGGFGSVIDEWGQPIDAPVADGDVDVLCGNGANLPRDDALDEGC